MTEETADSLIPYDDIVQEALRAVVGRVLGEIVDSGSELPGNHHFYITFKTGAPGVSIPDSLRERFPDESGERPRQGGESGPLRGEFTAQRRSADLEALGEAGPDEDEDEDDE